MLNKSFWEKLKFKTSDIVIFNVYYLQFTLITLTAKIVIRFFRLSQETKDINLSWVKRLQ